MTQVFTWAPMYNGLPHDSDNIHACSTSRPKFNLNAASMNRPMHEHKRKRSDAYVPPVKKQKHDARPEPASIAYQQPRPLAPAARPSVEDDGMALSVSAVAGSSVNHIALEAIATSPMPQKEAFQSSLVATASTLPRPNSCLDQEEQMSGVDAAQSSSNNPSVNASETAMKNRAIDKIEMHLNLMILQKHNELRLIETEIGKGQIMLEQLRRVNLIPFPCQTSSPTEIDNVITGTGAPLRTETGVPQPRHAPPFGAADGPYSRHYERWLLPDESFDVSVPPAPRMSRLSNGVPPVAPRKRAFFDEQTPARAPKRASSSQIPQLPTVTISVDGSSLLVVRKSEGEWVKVVCRVCGKQDAANLQGFTNHTRIAHSITYPNHKEAINDCGRQLDEHEAAQVGAATASQDNPASHPPSAISTPLKTGKPAINPLVFGNSSHLSASGQRVMGEFNSSDWRRSLPNTTEHTSSAALSSTFVSSADAPHLSRILAAKGSNLNLQELVTSSKMRLDLDQVQSLVPDTDDTPMPSPSAPAPHSRTQAGAAPVARMPARAHTIVSSDTPTGASGKPTSLQLASRVPTSVKPTTVPDSFSSEVSPLTASFAGRPVEDQSREQTHTFADPHHDDYSPTTNPGLVSDQDDDSDYAHASEHGDGAGRQDLLHVRVRGEHSDEYESLHHYEDKNPSHHGGQCAPGASYTDSVFFPGGQNNASSHAPVTQATYHGQVQSPQNKKKRGRPRKSEKTSSP